MWQFPMAWMVCWDCPFLSLKNFAAMARHLHGENQEGMMTDQSIA